MMMDMTVPGETGSLMGAWGMSQALANGMSQFVGGGIRDAGIALTGNYEASYASIFLHQHCVVHCGGKSDGSRRRAKVSSHDPRAVGHDD